VTGTTDTTDPGAAGPPRIVAALGRLDEAGRFASADLGAVREVVEGLRGVPLDHPAELFGPWAELPAGARGHLRRIVESDIVRQLDAWPRGDLWTGAVRAARSVDRWLAETGIGGWRRREAVRTAERLRGGPGALRRKLRRARHLRRWERGAAVGPDEVLTVLGRPPSWLMGDFVEGVRVDPRGRGFYDDRRRNILHGYHVSLDLIPTGDGYVLSEVNLQPGAIRPAHDDQFGESFSEGVVEEAQRHRMRRIHLVEVHRLAAPDWMLERLDRLTRRHGLGLEVFEDPCMPRRRSEPPGGFPGRWPRRHLPPPHTLVVRRNDLGVGPDHLLDHKGALARGLAPVLEARGERRVRILRSSPRPVAIPEPAHPGLPNLVYKYPRTMAGAGVFFLRVESEEEALEVARRLDAERGGERGLFQPFVASTLVEGCVQDHRAWAFLSPRGIRYLGAVRARQHTPVPERVPRGRVSSEDGAFIPKEPFGGSATDLDPSSEARVREVTAVLGEALLEMLGRTFVTASTGPRPPGGPGR
jgi:hypothetical protein